MTKKNIISKIYYIATDNLPGRFEKIKERLNTKIPIIRVSDIGDKTINDIADKDCKYSCSNKSVGKWLTHYNLWKSIDIGSDDNVLILEDSGLPIKLFSSVLEEYWEEVPKNYDILYLGCTGSCEDSIIKDITYKIIHSKSNNDIYKNGKKMQYLMEPGFPLGLYGYMISKKGIRKLLNNKDLKTVSGDLDYCLAKTVIGNENLKTYAFNPPLIKYIPKKENTSHEIMEPFTDKLMITRTQSIKKLWDTSAFHFRPLDVDISYVSLFLFLIAFIIGYFTSQLTQKSFLSVLFTLQLIEMTFISSSVKKIKDLSVEFTLTALFYYAGKRMFDTKK
jgi:hypothetical protein